MLPHDEVHNEIRHTFDPAPPPPKKKKNSISQTSESSGTHKSSSFQTISPRSQMADADRRPQTPNPKPQTRDPKQRLYILNPKPPGPMDPRPGPIDPKPETPRPRSPTSFRSLLARTFGSLCRMHRETPLRAGTQGRTKGPQVPGFRGILRV